jgi:hypothetical protein
MVTVGRCGGDSREVKCIARTRVRAMRLDMYEAITRCRSMAVQGVKDEIF